MSIVELRRHLPNREYKSIFQFTQYVMMVYSLISTFSIMMETSTEYYSSIYNWDIDHEMYFGSRLLHGELLFTIELHDKLPVVQYIFAIPALLRSVQVFKILCIFMTLYCVKLVYSGGLLLSTRQSNARVSPATSLNRIWICILYLQILSITSIFHITTICANCVIISITLHNNSGQSRNLNPSKSRAYNAAAVFFGALAISIRPYIALSLIILNGYLWVFYDDLAFRGVIPRKITRDFWRLLTYLFAISCTTILINATPYLVSGHVINFVDGLRHNAKKLNPSSYQDIVNQQWRELVSHFESSISIGELLVCVFVIIIMALNQNDDNYDSISFRRSMYVCALLSIIFIEVLILQRHFWPNYLAMAAPFICLFLANLFNRQELLAPYGRIEKIFAHYNITIILITMLGISVNIVSETVMHSTHPDEDIVRFILETKSRNTEQDTEFNFIDFNSMYVHWKLDESRHGFPQAANVEHIEKGWWKNTQQSDIIDFPYTLFEICRKIESSNLTLVVIRKNTSSNTCFSEQMKEYDKVELIDKNAYIRKNRYYN